MGKKFALSLLSASVLLCSCKQSPTAFTDYAKKWTADMKARIMKESSLMPDKTTVDSTTRIITHYKNGVKLKQIYFADREEPGADGKLIYDTVKYVYFGTNPDFMVVVDPCINKVYRSYETVAYKNNSYGLIEYVECGTNIKEIGFHCNNDNVGPWIKYDVTGKPISKVEAGNEEKLEILKKLTY